MKLASIKLNTEFKQKGRVFWEGSSGNQRLICLSSQPYKDPSGHGYWYGFKPGQQVFLEEGKSGYVLLACGLEDPPLLFPWADFQNILPKLKTTTKEDGSTVHWHIAVIHGEKTVVMNVPLGNGRQDMTDYLLSSDSA